MSRETKTNKIKVGILITKPGQEKKKEELIHCASRTRPWLDVNIPSHLRINNSKNKKCVPGDVSVGLYMQHKDPKIEIDFIKPNEITEKRLKGNLINFMVIYDLLESFHTDKDKKRKNFRKVTKILSKAKNIYPSFEYQQFVNDKSKYLEYFTKKKVNVIPTFKVSCETLKEKRIDGTIKHIINHVKKRPWNGKFIAKPIFGQESIDFKAFKDGLDDESLQKTEKELKKYLNKIMVDRTVKYPGILIQKYIEGFDEKKPEIRMYFFDENYKYSIITHDGKVDLPTVEKGKMKVNNLNELKKFAKKILDKTPGINIGGTKLPKALTRIDIACDDKFGKPWIVNEIEFVPSLYVEDVKKIPEIYLGDAFLKIVNKFNHTAPTGRRRTHSKKSKRTLKSS